MSLDGLFPDAINVRDARKEASLVELRFGTFAPPLPLSARERSKLENAERLTALDRELEYFISAVPYTQ